jgi:hypothetical protein
MAGRRTTRLAGIAFAASMALGIGFAGTASADAPACPMADGIANAIEHAPSAQVAGQLVFIVHDHCS